MHELSLVRSLLGQVDRIRSENDGLAVDEIHIEVGPLSGVEAVLLQSAFEQVAVEYDASGARLVINEVPLMAGCTTCGPVAVEPVRIRCPHCGRDDVQIISGDEVRLCSVTIRCPDRQEQAV
jgi:hydrogenase nickel incorporation protein HypA/HybF